MRALISVFEKKGIVDFAKGLADLGCEIISTGGTFKLLKENGVEVISVEDFTSYPEILGGRVKTLNPKIHGGILYKRDDEEHIQDMKTHNLKTIDIVVNNLYPFEETIKKTDDVHQIVEMIDIGGPTMIRSAAKNYKDVLIVTDYNDYNLVIKMLKSGKLDIEFRKKLAQKAFYTTAKYDMMISNYFSDYERKDYNYFLESSLRYGENPHQKASFYIDKSLDERYLADMTKLHGKELSYNNLVDMYAAVKGIKIFDMPAAVAIKHTNPCGIGQGQDIYDAYIKAYECDDESIFGGIVAFNRQVNAKLAEKLSEIFLEIVIAPSFETKALEILTQKKNIRLIEIKNMDTLKIDNNQFKQVLNGMLVQDYDDIIIDEKNMKVVSKRKPTDKEKEDMYFAFKAAKLVASNGIVVAKDGASLGIGQGQTKRSWAVEEAIKRAGEKVSGAVLASDGFFFKDTMELVKKSSIKAVIQPGGSVKDEEVIKYADENDISVVFTGIRHFRH